MLATAGSALANNPNDSNWDLSWPQARVKMPLAWDLATGSKRVIIAVVDSGINPNVKDLRGNLVPGRDFISGGYTKIDRDGHGTLVASIIAARGNNGSGIAGYCWTCKVMPVRVGDGTVFDSGAAAQGIRWAADNGARVISLSFSEDAGSLPDPRVAAAVAYAAAKGALVLASAGNTYNSAYTFPAADPGAYAVAGTDRFDRLMPWSTRGSWIHLAAPGCQLALSKYGGAIRPCGTSVAAPAVAGIAGLMLSVNPSLSPEQIVSLLEKTAVPVAGIGGGRVNAYGALLAAGASAVLRAGGEPVRLSRYLRGSWQLNLSVQGSRVAATLRSPKARSCALSLESPDSVWLASKRGGSAESLVAALQSGKYRLVVTCRSRQPRLASLTVRAFAK